MNHSRNQFTIGLLALAAIIACQPQTQPGSDSFENLPFIVSKELPELSTLLFRMSQGGDSLGYTQVEYIANDDSLTVKETTRVNFGTEFYETIHTSLSMNDLNTGNSKIFLRLDTAEYQFKTKWKKDSVYIKQADSKSVKTLAKHSNLVDRLLTFYLFPRIMSLPANKPDTVNYASVSAMDSVARNIRLIAVPHTSGMIELNYTGGVAEQNMILSDRVPRKILSITFQDLPWKYELLD